MPNLKVYVLEEVYSEKRAALKECLPQLLAALCEDLKVQPKACQIAVQPVMGLSELYQTAAELAIMPNPARTPEVIAAVSQRLRGVLEAASGQETVVRVTIHDPARFSSHK